MPEFVDGIRAYKKRENAPSFVIADVTIKSAELATWLASQPDMVRLQLLESKKGTYYFAVNTYQNPVPVAQENEEIIIDESEENMDFPETTTPSYEEF